jgi:NAD(P)H-flavin reductase
MVTTGAADQPVQLLFGVNASDELFGLDQLSGYTEKGLDLTVELAVVEPSNGWSHAVGHVTSLLRYELVDRGQHVYLCGPPPMIEAGESWLADHGVDENRVHTEKFLPS